MLSSKKCAAAVAAALFVTAPLCVHAQTTTTPPAQSAAARLDMNQAELRNGISVNRLIGMNVRGQKGDQLGEVQDVIVSNDGKVQAIMFKSGGFAKIGDALFRVAWNELKFDNAMNRVTVPLTEQNVERYQERGQPDQLKAGANQFRATSVIGDAATLRDGSRWGEIQDMIVTRAGQVRAVLVDTATGPGGIRAVPFRANAFNANNNAYALEWDRNVLTATPAFDYRAMSIAEPRNRTGTTGTTGGGTGSGGMERPARASRG